MNHFGAVHQEEIACSTMILGTGNYNLLKVSGNDSLATSSTSNTWMKIQLSSDGRCTTLSLKIPVLCLKQEFMQALYSIRKQMFLLDVVIVICCVVLCILAVGILPSIS